MHAQTMNSHVMELQDSNQFKKEPYSDHSVADLENYLATRADAGMPVQYKVLVDGREVVPRTSDPKAFSQHINYLTVDTRQVIFCQFHNTSNNNHRTILYFPENVHGQTSGLDGIVTQHVLEEALRQQQEKFDHDRKVFKLESELKQSEEEMERLKAEGEKFLERIIELEEEVEQYKGKGTEVLGNLMKGVGSFVGTNGEFKDRLASASVALAGNATASSPTGQSADQLAAELEGEQGIRTLSEGEQRAIDTFHHLQQIFGEDRYRKLSALIKVFRKNPALLDKFYSKIKFNHSNQQTPSHNGNISENDPSISHQRQGSHSESDSPESTRNFSPPGYDDTSVLG